MKTLAVHLLALLLCSALPAMLYLGKYFVAVLLVFWDPALWYQFLSAFALVTAVAAEHAVGLGLPVYFWVQIFSPFTYRVAIVCGFIVGAIPIAIYAWPLDLFGPKSSFSVKGVEMTIDGVPTMAGWLYYFEWVCLYGVLGSSGALMFKYVLQKFA